MVIARFEFTAGRYHGTRWGSHVNEADMDWPPSPWRICRALLAIGYTRLGWNNPLSPEATMLLDQLARAPVTFHLPPAATPSHTRHYMPQYKKGATSKVLDAFLRLPRGSSLFVQWALDLDPPSRELLRVLLNQMSYLGRAESWVEADLVDEVPPGQLRCSTDRVDDDSQAIELLCPMGPEAYAEWRSQALSEAESADLLEKQAKNKEGPKKLTPAQRRRLEAQLPANVSAAMSIDTGALKKAGWNRPPGATACIFWRPKGAIVLSPVRTRHVPTRTVRPTMALLQLTSDTQQSAVLPALKTAIRRAQWIHRRMASLADGRPWAGLFVGATNGSATMEQHRHTHIMPQALGFRGARDKLPDAPIDHVLLWCPEGYVSQAQDALLGLRRDFIRGADLSLALVGFGDHEAFASLVPPVRAARVFISRTPWVPPRFLKAKGVNSVEGQILRGLQQRGLPAPLALEMETPQGWKELGHNRRAPWWRRFELERRHGDNTVHKGPKQQLTFGVRIRFEQPVRGPIALGYGSHFGLGQFWPESTT